VRRAAPLVKLLLVAVAAAIVLCPSPARADFFVSPFIGLKFKGATNEFDPENGASETKMTLGAAATLVADKGPGLEVEVGYNPRFFERAERNLVANSGVTTLFGNVIVALPLSVTRESLRPYAVGGLGWIHASANDLIGFEPFSNDFLGLALGGGAIGFVTDTTGVRFDLRYLKSVSSGDVSELNQESARISFWRATVGLVFR
jgi:hypothetical protein